MQSQGDTPSIMRSVWPRSVRGLLQDHSLSAYSRQIGDVRAALQWSFSPSGDTTVGVALGVGAALLFLNLSMLSLQEHFGCEASRSGGTFCASRHRVRPRRGHPVTLCICLIYGVQVFLWRGNEHVAAELIEGLIAVAEKHSLAPYHACGLVRFGELLVARGETAAGVEHLRRARSILAAERNYILFPTIARALAEALVREGQSEEALDLIETAVTNAERGTGTFDFPTCFVPRRRCSWRCRPKIGRRRRRSWHHSTAPGSSRLWGGNCAQRLRYSTCGQTTSARTRHGACWRTSMDDSQKGSRRSIFGQRALLETPA